MLRFTRPARMIPIIDKFSHGVCKITLDNPKSLNAVDHETVVHMRNLLFDHLNKKDTSVTRAFVIRGGGEKSFCSGGDVVTVVKNEEVRAEFFYTEYQVNHAIGEVVEAGVPYVALWNGIVMGGGFGVSVHGSHRVATPKTLFAMPETAIGLFPDVGGSWVLPRLPFDGLGLYLALSGARLKGSDLVHAGLGTHYVNSIEKLNQLEKRLLDSDSVSQPVDAIVAEFSDAKNALTPFSLEGQLPNIEKHFGKHHESLASVIDGLRGNPDKWSQDLLTHIKAMSPTSVAVSFEAHRRGEKCKTRAEMFEMEYRLSQSMANHNDFISGVDALLITKHKKPQWSPATLEELDEKVVQQLFEKRDPRQPTWDPRTPQEEAFTYLMKK